MAKVQPAFTAKFRVVSNPNPANDYAPEKNVIFDFTLENAQKAAEFFMNAYENALKNNTKIRVYTDKKEYHEEAGFTLWGGMWGNSGKLAPLPPKDQSQSNPDSGEKMIDVNDLPF